MTDPKQRLAEIEQRVNAATQGPWDYYLEQGYAGCGVVVTFTEDSQGYRSLGDSVFRRLVTSEENKIFIANAKQDIPWLIERVRRLEAALEFVRGQRDGILMMHESKLTEAELSARICRADKPVDAILRGEGSKGDE